MKRLFFAASIAVAFLISNPQEPAEALLPHAHTGLPPSFHQALHGSLAERIAYSAQLQAQAMSSVGYCYRGVKRALNQVGVHLTGTAAWMARSQLQDDSRFCRVPISRLERGDILVHGRSRVHPYGHIAVYLGHGREASDHVQHLVLGGRYGATVVFRPRGQRSALPQLAMHAPAVSGRQRSLAHVALSSSARRHAFCQRHKSATALAYSLHARNRYQRHNSRRATALAYVKARSGHGRYRHVPSMALASSVTR